MSNENKGKSSLGIEENIAGLLCYIGGFVTGLIFFILEKESKFVKFHGMQSIIVSITFTILYIILPFIPFVGWMILAILPIANTVLWVILMLKTYKYEYFKLPIIGDIAEKYSGEINI